MADISQITLPSGNIYNLKDTYARTIADSAYAIRNKIWTVNTALQDLDTWAVDTNFAQNNETIVEALLDLKSKIAGLTPGGESIVFRGIIDLDSPAGWYPTDGGSQGIYLNDNTASHVTDDSTHKIAFIDIPVGSLYFYGNQEFIKGSDSKWHSLGPQLQTLGALAYKDSVSVQYVKTTGVTSTFTGDNDAITIEVNDQIEFPLGGNYTPKGTVTLNNLGLKSLSSTASYTPAGSINGGTFTGTAATIKVSGTPSGTVTQPTFSGAALNSTGNYTPAGTINLKTAGSTTQIKNPAAVTVAKTLNTSVPSTAVSGRVTNEITYCDVNGENLRLYQVGYTTGNSITTTNTTVKTGDGAYEFTALATTITTSGTPAGTVSQPTFNGAAATYSGNYTPGGSISSLSFSGTPATITASGTPSFTTTPTASFSGQAVAISGFVTPTGSINSTPTTATASATVTIS